MNSCRTVPIKRFLIALSFAALIACAFPISQAKAGASTNLTIHKAITTSYPDMELELGLSAKDRLTEFNVTENKRLIKNVQANQINEKISIAITLLIDVSGSMAGQRLEDAKAAANVFIQQITQGDKVSVIAFSTSSQKVVSFTDDKEILRKAIDSLQAKGETAVYDALAFGLNDISRQAADRKSVILLSDGGDTASRTSGNHAIELVTGHKIPVQTIIFMSKEANPEILKKIAINSGGQMFEAPDSATLRFLYGNFASDLYNRYKLNYESSSSGDIRIEVEARSIENKTYQASKDIQIMDAAPMQNQKERPVKIYIISSLHPLVISLLGFLSAFLLILSLANLLKPTKNILAKQLSYYDHLHQMKPNAPSIDGETRLKSIFNEITDFFSIKIFSAYGFTEFTGKKLEQAGLTLRPNEYMAAHILTVSLVSVFLSTVSKNISLILLVIIFMAVAPLLVIQVMIEKRKAKFNEQLPETLDFMANSMRVGLGLHQAIISCSKEMESPMSDELSKICNQVELGSSLLGALNKSAEQLGDENFDLIVMGISIHSETGGNLSEILNNIAINLREKSNLKRQVDVLTAEGRLSAIILIALPFVEAAILFLLNPGYISLLVTSLQGIFMLGTAILLIVVGSLWLKKIVNLEEY